MNSTQGTALITGASSGLGARYATELAARGFDLVLVARNADRLSALAESITSDTGRRVDVLAADLTDKSGLAAVEARLVDDQTITLLVNNAGGSLFGPVGGADVEAYENLIALNITALTRLTNAVLPGFQARNAGTIVNVGSAMTFLIMPVSAVYSATKSYVLAFTQSLQLQLADTGIRVQAVLPGAVRTDFWGGSGIELSDLPDEMVMSVEDAVDAALAGLDAGELVTIPALEESAHWETLDAHRNELAGIVSRSEKASRYRN